MLANSTISSFNQLHHSTNQSIQSMKLMIDGCWWFVDEWKRDCWWLRPTSPLRAKPARVEWNQTISLHSHSVQLFSSINSLCFVLSASFIHSFAFCLCLLLLAEPLPRAAAITHQQSKRQKQINFMNCAAGLTRSLFIHKLISFYSINLFIHSRLAHPPLLH